MRHWSQLGIRNWQVRPGRTAGAVGAIALGVGVVVWVTCAYESVRLALQDQVWFWIGRSHLSIESVHGPVGTVYQSLTGEVAALDNVRDVTCRLEHYMMLHPLGGPPGATRPVQLPGEPVQAIGIDPRTEYLFRDYSGERVPGGGRLLTPEDTDAAVAERELAAQLGLEIGDRFVLRATPSVGADDGPLEKWATFTLVGIIERRRVAKRQLPVVVTMLQKVQALAQFADDAPRVTKIDMILNDASPKALRNTENAVRDIVDRQNQDFLVTSAEGKLRQVENAERQTGFVLLLLSSVALFTGFFIILSTLSMGMVERIGQLGMLRCLGATRIQIAMLVLSEAVPLGVLGMILGIPVGLGLARLTVWMAPEYVGELAISKTGLLLALIGGGITTLAGAGLPVLQALRVSPLTASRPQSQPPPVVLTWVAALVGIGMIAGHSYMIAYLPAPKWLLNAFYPVAAVTSLYAGYALVTPVLIRVIGQLAVLLAAGVLRVRPRLLGDQVGRAAWRSATICCGLMVGLSLIVSLVVHSKSLAAGWDFPRDFAEAFVFITPPIPRSRAQQIQQKPGIASSCLVNEGLRCTVYGRGFFHFPWSHFVAGDPDGFFKIANLEFVEGNQAEAIAKLKRGGYVLVTPQFTRAQKLTYRDKVPIQLKDSDKPPVLFEIAGVVTSPALDIAANYFNQGGLLLQASVFVVMGTFADAQRVFGAHDVVSMFLINFDLPSKPPPPEFQAESPPPLDKPAALAGMLKTWRPLLPKRIAELDRIEKECRARPADDTPLHWADAPMLRLFQESLAGSAVAQWSGLSPEQRWHAFREELVMRLIAAYGGSSTPLHTSVRALKQRIDRDLERATILLASVPMVALIVAALGVGNLMMANVTSRTRQIAVLRSIGATKWQVTRLVIGEAVVLGCLGSMVGVVLGLHAARGLNAMTVTIWGYKPEWAVPWGWVGLGIAFTMSVCLIAGVFPARHASRNNIIDALQTT